MMVINNFFNIYSKCHFEVLQHLAHLLVRWGFFVQESQV